MDYVPDPDTGLLTEEYVDVFGIPFSLIPFKGRESGKGGGQHEDRPKHVVAALPERRDLEIRFPVVEGYVTAPTHNRIVCDVNDVEATVLDPAATPSTTTIRPEVGYKIGSPAEYDGFVSREVDRTEYYKSVHGQEVAFRIAAEVVGALTGGAVAGSGKLRRMSRQELFPQVLAIVTAYLRDRVDLSGMRAEDVGLDLYRKRIVGLLVDAISPADAEGKPAELPRLNRYRPEGRTRSVYFKTVKPVVATTASHVNYVACDTERWEQVATDQLERLARDRVVESYVRNERLEFVIPYTFQGNDRGYEPDFLVRLKDWYRLIVEIKGVDYPETPAKHEAAKRWVRAVNAWRRGRRVGLPGVSGSHETRRADPEAGGREERQDSGRRG